MEIDTPSRAEADILADLWVSLARGQHNHGSHLAAETNRTPIYESICQHIVTDGVRVARDSDAIDQEHADGEHVETDIVGFIMFTARTGRYEETVSAGVIENLYVMPDWRSEGIGSALLSTAEDELEADGIEIITLDVMASNRAARRFYSRHGYATHRVTMAKRKTDTHSKDE
ncbi:GNAT family N-acetyltransferase [Halocatena marina]|uniref:GNAT family N-acetyltransferase n=1 Tax=Halocatena marina TaxID=2934937 RepID=A0ABD5YQB4_9EURY|nr:GNAT family N-acetyltransferase [Halocatena marina]